MSLYKGCKTAVLVDGSIKFIFCESWSPSRVCFESTVVHYGNGCSDRRCVRDRSLMKLLYADDLVLCGESLNDIMGKYKRWKNAVEGKGLRVSVDKAKGMQLSFGKESRGGYKMSEVGSSLLF